MQTRHLNSLRFRSCALVALISTIATISGGCVASGAASHVGIDCTSPPRVAAGASLAFCPLAGLNLSSLNLTGADLHGADLTGADLHGTNLTNANLEGANLTNANLTNANLAGAILSGAILLGALFIGASMAGVQLDFGHVWNPNGSSGSGSGGGGGTCANAPYCSGYNEATSFHGESICDAVNPLLGFQFHYTTAQLETASQRSVVTNAQTSFAGATISGNSLFNLRGLNMALADFTGATISGQAIVCKSMSRGHFDGATFNSTPFVNTDATDAHFRGATFKGLDSSELCSVDFSRSDLRDARFLDATDAVCTDVGPPFPERWSVTFDDADLSGAVFGNVVPGPNSYNVVRFGIADTTGPSFLRTNLTGVSFHDVIMRNGDFTGANASNTTVTGVTEFQNTVFGTGWSPTTWTGTAYFDNAVCPDASTGSPANPCFVVTP